MMDFVTAEPCLCFEVVKENGSFGIQIVGGLDQDSAKNPFCPGDSGIFIHMIENGSPAHKAGNNFQSQLRDQTNHSMCLDCMHTCM